MIPLAWAASRASATSMARLNSASVSIGRPALETLQSLAVFGDFLGKELQRDKAPELAVLSLIDDAHPTAAQPFNDAIVGYDLGNHERRKPDNTEVAILGGIRWAAK